MSDVIKGHPTSHNEVDCPFFLGCPERLIHRRISVQSQETGRSSERALQARQGGQIARLPLVEIGLPSLLNTKRSVRLQHLCLLEQWPTVEHLPRLELVVGGESKVPVKGILLVVNARGILEEC